jgi:hypothetical protein
MLRNCDCGACCEACGHYDGCIRNAGRQRDAAAEVAMEDGFRPSRGASLIKRRTHAANPLPGQQDRRAS